MLNYNLVGEVGTTGGNSSLLASVLATNCFSRLFPFGTLSGDLVSAEKPGN